MFLKLFLRIHARDVQNNFSTALALWLRIYNFINLYPVFFTYEESGVDLGQ